MMAILRWLLFLLFLPFIIVVVILAIVAVIIITPLSLVRPPLSPGHQWASMAVVARWRGWGLGIDELARGWRCRRMSCVLSRRAIALRLSKNAAVASGG